MNYHRETKKTNPIYNCIKKIIKYLEMNLIKDVKDLYSENFNILKKRLKKIQISGSTHHVPGQEELTSLNVHTT